MTDTTLHPFIKAMRIIAELVTQHGGDPRKFQRLFIKDYTARALVSRDEADEFARHVFVELCSLSLEPHALS